MMRRKDLPKDLRLEFAVLLRDLSDGVPGALNRFSPAEGHEDIYVLESPNYPYKKNKARLWMAVAHRDAFDGVLHVLADVTGGDREIENALAVSADRLAHGERHEEHEQH